MVESGMDSLAGKGLPAQKLKLASFGSRPAFVASQDVQPGQPLMTVPIDLCVTKEVVDEDPALKIITEDKDSLTSIALWLMKQRTMGQDGKWGAYMRVVPLFTYSPITWSQAERDGLLRGSLAQGEANLRVQELERMWVGIAKTINAHEEEFKEVRSAFTFENFLDAFSVALAHAVYLPSVDKLALVPLVEMLPRVSSPPPSAAAEANREPGAFGPENRMALDYDASTQSVVLRAQGAVREGEEVYLSDEEPSSNVELLLSRGIVRPTNSHDFLIVNTNVVMADTLYTAKKQILEAYGLDEDQQFLVYKDRIPLELLSYLRLSRLQTTEDLLKLNFEKDQLISEMNEYEILQLLLTEARMISQGYAAPDTDTDRFVLRDPEASVPEKLAASLRAGEKQVVSSFMDAVRTRLAPIRGIPTKSGMENQNQEIIDMFDAMESIPKAPGRFVKSVADWWTDPENWKDPDEKK